MSARKTPIIKVLGQSVVGHEKTSLLERFESYIQDMNWGEAIDLAKQYEREIAGNARLGMKDIILTARDLINSLEYSEAAGYYCRALARDSRNLDALRGLAIIDLNMMNIIRSREIARTGISLNPNIVAFWSLEHCANILLGETNAEEDLNQRASFGNVDIGKILVGSAEYLSRTYPEEACRVYRRIAQRSDINLADWIAVGLPILKKHADLAAFREKNILGEIRSKGIVIDPNQWLNILPFASSIEDNKTLAEIQINSTSSPAIGTADYLASSLFVGGLHENGRRLRLGFIGGDFNNHVVARYLLPVIEGLDKTCFEVYCLNTRYMLRDQITERFESCATMIEVDLSKPSRMVSELRKLNLDIAIDVSGHTMHGALSIMEYRIAPLQASMFGYPGSTFTRNIDLLIVSENMQPRDPSLYSEDLLVIDEVAPMSVPVDFELMQIDAEPPQTKHGFVNFGVFISPYKYTSECIRGWAEILRTTGNSQLSIVRPEAKSMLFRENILAEFAYYGIGAERIVIVDNRSRGIPHWACYNKIDVALDTFPMSGGASVYDALIMGVPIVTIEGVNMHQRLSSTILRRLEMKDCIANDIAGLAKAAKKVCTNIERLREYRRDLRHKLLSASGTCSTDAYIRELERKLAARLRNR